jgi:hypothetical protein
MISMNSSGCVKIYSSPITPYVRISPQVMLVTPRILPPIDGTKAAVDYAWANPKSYPLRAPGELEKVMEI